MAKDDGFDPTMRRVERRAPAEPLDSTDRAIVAALVEDGRLSVNELARIAGISRATAYARFDRLRSTGIIQAVRAEVDPVALGCTVAALILVKVEQGAWEEVRQRLVHAPGFEYLAVTSGAFDFLVLVRAADIAALRDVVLFNLHRIPAVRSTETVFVLDESRRHPGTGVAEPGVEVGVPTGRGRG